MLASELYAISQGSKCDGFQSCHWCAAPCDRKWQHDDPPPEPFFRGPRLPAKRPASAYICSGCRLFRRPLLTANYLSGGLKDRQCPLNLSLWITPEGAWALRAEDNDALHRVLLKPPLRFALILRDGLDAPTNHLQLASANDHKAIQADTLLHFTINNIPHSYTVYELENVERNGVSGCEPGVGALARILRIEQASSLPGPTILDAKRGRGRPTIEEVAATQARRAVR